MSLPSNTAGVPAPRPEAPTLLTQLIQRHSPSLGALLERLGVRRGDIDDVRQRIWLTASRCSDRIHPGSERAFLVAVARREAGHARRAYQRRPEVTVAMIEEFVSTTLPSDEWTARRQRLEEARIVLDEMDASLRTVLLLVEVEEASTGDIAMLLDIPLGTAKSRLRRARADGLRRGAEQQLSRRAVQP